MVREFLVEAAGKFEAINSIVYTHKGRIRTGIKLSGVEAIFEESLDRPHKKSLPVVNIEVHGPVDERLLGRDIKYMARYRSGIKPKLIVQTLQEKGNDRVYMYH